MTVYWSLTSMEVYWQQLFKGHSLLHHLFLSCYLLDGTVIRQSLVSLLDLFGFPFGTLFSYQTWYDVVWSVCFKTSLLDVTLLFLFKGSLVRPKIVRSVHYCPKTKKTMERRYTDMTSLNAYPSVSVYPTKDDEGNPLETEYGLSAYKDHQTFTIQVSEHEVTIY